MGDFAPYVPLLVAAAIIAGFLVGGIWLLAHPIIWVPILALFAFMAWRRYKRNRV
jgi:hypothetical protein